jgi:hypothetical protein
MQNTNHRKAEGESLILEPSPFIRVFVSSDLLT